MVLKQRLRRMVIAADFIQLQQKRCFRLSFGFNDANGGRAWYVAVQCVSACSVEASADHELTERRGWCAGAHHDRDGLLSDRAEFAGLADAPDAEPDELPKRPGCQLDEA